MTTNALLPKDTKLVVLLSIPGAPPLRAIVQVAWTQVQRFGTAFVSGLRFIAILPEDQELLAKYVKGSTLPLPSLS